MVFPFFLFMPPFNHAQQSVNRQRRWEEDRQRREAEEREREAKRHAEWDKLTPEQKRERLTNSTLELAAFAEHVFNRPV